MNLSPPDPFELPTDPPAERRRSRREPMSGQTLFFVVVGVLVAVVMIFFLYDRAETYYHRKRLETINRTLPELQIDSLQHPGDTRLRDRVWELEEERRAIYRSHPDWKR